MSIKFDLIMENEELIRILNEYAQKEAQEALCEEVKSKIKKHSSMNLVNEEVLEDNSILLTIEV